LSRSCFGLSSLGWVPCRSMSLGHCVGDVLGVECCAKSGRMGRGSGETPSKLARLSFRPHAVCLIFRLLLLAPPQRPLRTDADNAPISNAAPLTTPHYSLLYCSRKHPTHPSNLNRERNDQRYGFLYLDLTLVRIRPDVHGITAQESFECTVSPWPPSPFSY